MKSDASEAKKITKLSGYAARPRWSHDGKQIAFLYIEGAGGGGPLVAAPATTGVIDTAIHNQRIAVLDTANRQLRQVSPPDLHIYDYDWSPNGKMFVATAAPGPGDNNWWIAQIYTIDSVKRNATSIYKPWFQVAVPRWSPDGKSIAFIEGLMSDEGFHGGDLFTMSADGRDVVNRTSSRKTSVNSFFWQAADRILLIEYRWRRQRNFRLQRDEQFGADGLGRTGRHSRIWKFPELRVVERWQIRRRGVAVPTTRHPKFSRVRLANGAKSRTTTLVCRRTGAKPKASSGRTKDLTFRAG